ncbi:hypothetical protein GCM10020331_006410 [Ectobacillus funiculus]
MAPANQRGRMVTMQDLMVVTGQLLAYIFNAILGNTMGDDAGVWRYMLVIATLPAVFLWFGMLIVPESPRWLASKGKMGDALRVLQRVREENQVKSEFSDIQTAVSEESGNKQATLKELAVPWVRRIVFLGIGISIVQQITGVNSIMYYGTEILKKILASIQRVH